MVLPLLGIYVVSEAPYTRVLAPTFEIPARALSAMHAVKMISQSGLDAALLATVGT